MIFELDDIDTFEDLNGNGFGASLTGNSHGDGSGSGYDADECGGGFGSEEESDYFGFDYAVGRDDSCLI